MHLTVRPGQTLLEMIIAIGIILSASLATTGLIITTIGAGRVSQDRVEAANLAREGIEVVRSVRDTNYLRRDQNIPDGPGCTVIDLAGGCPPVDWDDSGSATDGYTPLDCSTVTGASAYVARFVGGVSSLVGGVPGSPCTMNTLTADQLKIKEATRTSAGINWRYFTQTCPFGYTCTDTKYSRTINIRKYSGTAAPDVDLGETTAVGTVEYLDVTSTVTWRDRTGTKTLVAQERLYNWR